MARMLKNPERQMVEDVPGGAFEAGVEGAARVVDLSWSHVKDAIPHVGVALLAEKIIDLLSERIEQQLHEIDQKVDAIRYQRYKHGMDCLDVIKRMRAIAPATGEEAARDKDLINEAWRSFSISASTLQGVDRCKSQLAAASCSSVLGYASEAARTREKAEQELRQLHDKLSATYLRFTTQLLRFVHHNTTMRRHDYVISMLGLTGLTLLTGGLDLALVGIVVGVATIGKYSKKAEMLHREFSEVGAFGKDTFGGEWAEPRTYVGPF